jgi:nitrogen regulatory protein PII
MQYLKINVFVSMLSLSSVEEELKAINIAGITVSKVKGYGQHMNFYTPDWQETHARIEIFCEAKDKQDILSAIKQGVGNPASNNGFVAIVPVAEVFSL